MSPCNECAAECCRYFAFQIDTPRTKQDFDHIRWYLAHEKVRIYIEKNKWYMDIHNKCRYVTPDYRCSIYNTRPDICREHDTRDCEKQAEAPGYDRYFVNLEQFDEYLRERFKRGRSRGKKKNRKIINRHGKSGNTQGTGRDTGRCI